MGNKGIISGGAARGYFKDMADVTRKPCPQGCDMALEHAIISNPEIITKSEKNRLGIITKRVFAK